MYSPDTDPRRQPVRDHRPSARPADGARCCVLCALVIVAFARWRGLTAIAGLAVSFARPAAVRAPGDPGRRAAAAGRDRRLGHDHVRGALPDPRRQRAHLGGHPRHADQPRPDRRSSGYAFTPRPPDRVRQRGELLPVDHAERGGRPRSAARRHHHRRARRARRRHRHPGDHRGRAVAHAPPRGWRSTSRRSGSGARTSRPRSTRSCWPTPAPRCRCCSCWSPAGGT